MSLAPELQLLHHLYWLQTDSLGLLPVRVPRRQPNGIPLALRQRHGTYDIHDVAPLALRPTPPLPVHGEGHGTGSLLPQHQRQAQQKWIH